MRLPPICSNNFNNHAKNGNTKISFRYQYHHRLYWGKLPNTAEIWLDSIVDEATATSVINRMETLGFIFPSAADKAPFEELFETITILRLTEDVENKTIEMKASIKIKLPDAIIAATALVYGLKLVSRNLKDFSKIPTLTVIDPYSV